jgi:hypothetical protein
MRNKKCQQNLGRQILREEKNLADQDVDGRIILGQVMVKGEWRCSYISLLLDAKWRFQPHGPAALLLKKGLQYQLTPELV